MEAFFVIVLAAVMLAVGVLALMALRRVVAARPEETEESP